MFSTMPKPRPATTAPSGLSRPPSVAAAEAKKKIVNIIDGVDVPRAAGDQGAAERAERAGQAPRPASTRPVRMPTSVPDSGLLATARMARPSFVFWNSTNSSAGDGERDEQRADVLVAPRRRRRSARSRSARSGTGCRSALWRR